MAIGYITEGMGTDARRQHDLITLHAFCIFARAWQAQIPPALLRRGSVRLPIPIPINSLLKERRLNQQFSLM